MKFVTSIFVLALVAVFAIMNSDFIGGWLTHISPAPAASLRGEWVGHMDITGIHDPYLGDFNKEAVIRLKLDLTDSFIKTYGGPGVLVLRGEAPRAIQIKDVTPIRATTPSKLESGSIPTARTTRKTASQVASAAASTPVRLIWPGSPAWAM